MSLPLEIDWQWCHLHELALPRLYRMLAAREAVFVVEQNCAYQELDGLDLDALHLVGWSGGEVAACLRILGPGIRFDEMSIGRVMTSRPFRGIGLGREIMRLALARIDEEHFCPVRISAQTYLEKFYRSCGFEPVSETYLEDGIPHIEMLRTGKKMGS